MHYNPILKHNEAVYGRFMRLCYGRVCSGYIAAIPGQEKPGANHTQNKGRNLLKIVSKFQEKINHRFCVGMCKGGGLFWKELEFFTKTFSKIS